MGLLDIFKLTKIKEASERKSEAIRSLQQKLDEIGAERYDDLTLKLQTLEQNKQALESAVLNLDTKATALRNDIQDYEVRLSDIDEKVRKQTVRLSKIKELYKSVDYAFKNFPEANGYTLINPNDEALLDELCPSVTLKLHHMDVKSLSKAYRDNDKLIEKLLSQYASRYTTKANKSIYQLMVIALKAELQNVLFDLKYGKIEKSIDDIKKITAKYMKISSEGNQSIAGTMVKFIGELEYLFINAAKIEYNYYVKKEQIKQEQLALRQQMKEEAEERKRLEIEKKRIAQEETKYVNEIDKTKQQLVISTDPSEMELLQAKILELESKLSDVFIEKEKIAELQNGKAGNVYVISNLGAFGDSIFKIGMTRRIDPTERINELGSASVPFKFDIHSTIFSQDAVGLESELHKRLNDKRVNKVNMRKEFFYSTLDELEELVNELDPTAEFVKTMFAEEYNRSISSNENFDSVYESSDDDVDEDESDD
jgi:hypothetical protein